MRLAATVAAVLGLLPFAAPTALAVTYDAPIVLQLPAGDTIGNALRVNESGQVVGMSYETAPTGIVWSSAGVSTVLESTYTAYGINDSGRIVGTYLPGAGGGTFAFVWDPDLTLPALEQSPPHYPGVNPQTFAFGINNSGTIVGSTRYIPEGSFSTVDRGVTWDPSGDQTILVGVGAGYDINDSGVVAGLNQQLARPVRWSGGVVTSLDLLPGHSAGKALAINEMGQIVGNSGSWATSWGAAGSAVTALPTLAGWTSSVARDINDAGLIVGYATYADGSFRGVVWTADGGIILLDPLAVGGWSFANGVNNDGLVVGNNRAAAGAAALPVIWGLNLDEVPVPEPTAGALLIAGAILLRLRRGRPAA